MTQSASIRQITIIGTGLIGGSFALALRKHGFRGQIVGCDQPKVLARAKRVGAIHVGISDPIKACNGSDVVVLATPVGTIIELMERLAPHRLRPWISHVPQMISTALASTLVEEYGERAPLLESGGRALREMTRIASSPYSMWRDIALTNKSQIADALLKLEQKLANIRE